MNLEMPAHAEPRMSSQAIQKGQVLCRNDQKWEFLRKDIYRIYMTENNTLPKTMLMIDEQHNFKASPRKWKAKLKEWQYEKHLTVPEMKIVVAKAEKRLREESKDTLFIHHGLVIPPTKLENFKRRKIVRDSDPASPSAQTPAAVSYSTPRPEYESRSTVDRMDEIPEQVQGLEVSQSLETNSPADLRAIYSLPEVPSFASSIQTDAFQSEVIGISSDPVDNIIPPSSVTHSDQQFNVIYLSSKPAHSDTAFSSSTNSGQKSKLEGSSGISGPVTPRTQTRTILEKNNINSSHIASAFLEAVETQARLKQQEGGDNILVYQRMSELAKTKMLEDRMDLYVALCSLVVTGYKKFLGPKALGTLMTIEMLADGLQRIGKYEEAATLYQRAIGDYEDLLEGSCQEVCKASGPHIHELPSVSYEFQFSGPVWCQHEECGRVKPNRYLKESQSCKGLNYIQQIRLFESPKHRTVNLLQCLLVKYLAFELREGAGRSNHEIVDLLSHLRSLYKTIERVTQQTEKAITSESYSWAPHHWKILDMAEEKRKDKETKRFSISVAKTAVEVAELYFNDSLAIRRMLFSPVLARFEAPGYLPAEWSSWKAMFYGLYAARLDRGHDASARHMLTSIESFVQEDGIDGLADPLAQYLLEKLSEYRSELEEDLTLKVGVERVVAEEELTEEAENEELRMKRLREEEQLSKRKQMQMREQARENVLITKIIELENWVAANVSSDKACTICFGICACKGYY